MVSRVGFQLARQIFEIGNQLEDVLKNAPATQRKVIEVGVLNGTPRAFGHALLRSLRTYSPSAQLVLREGDLDDLLQDLREFRLEALLTDVSIRSQDREEFESSSRHDPIPNNPQGQPMKPIASVDSAVDFVQSLDLPYVGPQLESAAEPVTFSDQPEVGQ